MTLKPSDVNVLDPLPLVDVFGRAEREQAGAVIVRACQVLGDQWQALTPGQVGDVLLADIDAFKKEGKNHPWNHPFFRPDVHDLVARGMARFVGAPGRGQPVELTPEGLAAIERRLSRIDAAADRKL